MFVRWKHKPLQPNAPRFNVGWLCEHKGPGRIGSRAFLVRAVRVDGRPRQKIAVQIGVGVRSCCLVDVDVRCRFWSAARATLESILSDVEGDVDDARELYPGLDRATLARCVASLAHVVPEPSPAEMATWRERSRLDTERAYAAFSALFASIRNPSRDG